MKLPEYFYFKVCVDPKKLKIILEDRSDQDVVEIIRCN